MELRPRHLEGMSRLSEHIICAGGLLDDEGKMKGSALKMNFDSHQDSVFSESALAALRGIA